LHSTNLAAGRGRLHLLAEGFIFGGSSSAFVWFPGDLADILNVSLLDRVFFCSIGDHLVIADIHRVFLGFDFDREGMPWRLFLDEFPRGLGNGKGLFEDFLDPKIIGRFLGGYRSGTALHARGEAAQDEGDREK
jgi:hypothetical protein